MLLQTSISPKKELSPLNAHVSDSQKFLEAFLIPEIDLKKFSNDSSNKTLTPIQIIVIVFVTIPDLKIDLRLLSILNYGVLMRYKCQKFE